MIRSVWAVALLAASVGAAADPPQSPTDKPAAIRKQVSDAEAEFYKTAKTLPDTPEGEKQYRELYAKFDKVQQSGFAAAVEIARADPKSDAGFAALEWVLTTPRAYYVPPGISAMELANERYAAEPKIGKVIALLGYFAPHPKHNPKEHTAAVTLIRAVAGKNPDRTARGQAALALAWQAKRAFEMAEYESRKDVETLATDAERQFESVLREYGDCPNLRTRGARAATATLAGEVEPELFEIRNLRAGKPAPEIMGTDLDGVPVKLSGHKGKVVLLVFWAGWCGPCMGAVPHERELVERFKDRPFVLLGVNGDDTLAAARKAVGEAKINWRSFWNGVHGPSGPIARAWNVRGWPTVYVIDHAGVIREKYLIDKQLDGPLEKLVAAAEAAKK